MTEQEKLAREWAEHAKNAEVSSPEQQAAADFILAHTAPPTMADVQWDAREHLGTIGVGEDGVEWVMLGRRPDGRVVGITADFQKLRDLRPKWLTPNGKRFRFVEATVSSNENVGAGQQDHPDILFEIEDFANAPTFTIICDAEGGPPAVKRTDGTWMFAGMGYQFTNANLAEGSDEPMQVLRWGRGK